MKPELLPQPTLRTRLAQTRVLVVGDAMLDRYWFGDIERISPEAPVPIVHVQRSEERLGGAANVACNVAALGAQASLICIVGDDEPGRCITELLGAHNIQAHLEQDADWATTIKLRIMARQQHVLRADFEAPPTHEILQAALARFESVLPTQDIVLFSDYAKGGLTHITQMITAARTADKPVLIDPKGDMWEPYRGATLITPNRAELREVIGRWRSEDDLAARVAQLRVKLDLQAVLLTRSEEGMTLYSDNGVQHTHAEVREVYDVSGAGDTVAATLAALMGAGLSLPDAVVHANRAAGIVIGKLGAAAITYDELFPSTGE